MVCPEATSLLQVFARIRDYREPRGKRHPLPAVLSLVFLGMLARIREMAVLERWAQTHWDQIKKPLGFTRDQPPHATTISRTLARCSLGDFSQAFLQWVQTSLPPGMPLVAAVDGKTSCQGHDAQGDPIHILNVFVHDLKVVLGSWSVSGEKTNEPTALRNHLSELFGNFPLLRLITGDAIFAQRPLAKALLEADCDYLVQIKNNQPDVLEATEQCLGAACERPPAAETVEKKGTPRNFAGCGSTWIPRTTFARS